jgi:tRNA threonylcarbamoyladenosine biosynthesis protein TsaB
LRLIILALDTALDACSVAIVGLGETRAHLSEAMSRGQAERVAPMVMEAANAAGLELPQIDRIVVTIGPGSFTGVRVGLAFARGLALALRKPCIGVSTLEALALEAGEQGLRGAIIETPGALYAAGYEDGRPLMSPVRIERAEAPARYSAMAGGRTFVLRGPGAMRVAHAMPNVVGVEAASPDTRELALRAVRLDPERYPPRPLYLRAAVGEPT